MTAPAQSPHVSLVLKLYKDTDNTVVMPREDVACTDCPISLWYSDSNRLICFCSALHKDVWDGSMAPIRFCDGREQAIAAIHVKLSGSVN